MSVQIGRYRSSPDLSLGSCERLIAGAEFILSTPRGLLGAVFSYPVHVGPWRPPACGTEWLKAPCKQPSGASGLLSCPWKITASSGFRSGCNTGPAPGYGPKQGRDRSREFVYRPLYYPVTRASVVLSQMASGPSWGGRPPDTEHLGVGVSFER
jgi:hypothetical protein